MTDPFSLVVAGDPAPQGSKRHVGRGRLVESSKKVKPWREAVAWEALAAKPGTGTLFTGPVFVEITFTVRKPLGAPKRRRTYPAVMPDIDKYVRSTFDALTTAGIWKDDGQVVEVHARKVYPGEHHQALAETGARIHIREMTE